MNDFSFTNQVFFHFDLPYVFHNVQLWMIELPINHHEIGRSINRTRPPISIDASYNVSGLLACAKFLDGYDLVVAFEIKPNVEW